MVEKYLQLLNVEDFMETLIDDQLTLEDFKNFKDFMKSMEIIIDNFKKEPTHESYHELEAHVMQQVMSSFYTPEFDKSLYDLIVK